MATEVASRPTSHPSLLISGSAPAYERHRPEETALHTVVREQLETFLARAREGDRPAPRFIEQELRAYLRCGILAHGFLRLHCDACGNDRLVPFSCKRRGFCPSCGGRRMADTAAHLVDCVLPEVPIRQWVLTLPYPLRYRCAYDAALTGEVFRAFLRALISALRRRTKSQWAIPHGQSGSVTVIQRFGSALNLNVHFHTLALDGVYTCDKGNATRFLPLPRRARMSWRAYWPGRHAALRDSSQREPRATTTPSPATSPCSPRWRLHRCALASRWAPARANDGNGWATASSPTARGPNWRPPHTSRSTAG